MQVSKGNKVATIGEDTSKQIIEEKSDPSTEGLIVKDTIKGSEEDKEEREKITIEVSLPIFLNEVTEW